MAGGECASEGPGRRVLVRRLPVRLGRSCVTALLLASCVSGEPAPAPVASSTTVSESTSTVSPVTGVTFIDVPDPGDSSCAGDTFPAALRLVPSADQTTGSGDSDLIAGTGDFVWISSWENASLTQVDLRTMCVETTLTVGTSRSTVIDLAATDGYIWAAEFAVGSPLLRIDVSTGELVSTIPGVPAGGGGMVGTDTDVFVACCGGDSGGSDPITRVDIGDETVSTVAIRARNWGIDVGFGALWVGSTDPASLTRIDLETENVTDVIPMDGPVGDVAVSADAVWVADTGTPALVRVDPVTMQVIDTIELGSTGGRFLDVEVNDDGDLWVAGRALLPTKIDGETGEVIARVKVSGRHVLIVGDRVLFTTPAGWLVILVDP